MQIKSKQRETTKEIVREQEGGGRWGFSSKCSWDIQVSHSVDWSPVKLHLHPQISGETALIQHWSGVYFPLEPGARGSGLLISTTPKKHNKKAKIHHKHTVDEVLEELRYKNQSILFTWLLLSSDKHLGIVGLWGCIAHSCIVLTARLENSCFVVVFSLFFFFKIIKNHYLLHQFGSVHMFAEEKSQANFSPISNKCILHKRRFLQSNSWNIFKPFIWTSVLDS